MQMKPMQMKFVNIHINEFLPIFETIFGYECKMAKWPN